jgi:uncharacterized membrane protein
MPKSVTISPVKFVLFSILTLGCYDIYWAWRVWETVRRSRNEVFKFKSSLRAYLMVLSNFILFPQLLELAAKKGYVSSVNRVKMIATIYAAAVLIGNGNATPWWLWGIMVVVSSIALVPIVKMHNHYVLATKAKFTPSKPNYWLIFVTITLWVALVLISTGTVSNTEY